ncbi:MAG: RNA polymerase subunit sigma-24 [Gammaproteobacteria bacterium HGW-Gammaproteobacteria-12]|nr:MAG: RNA polymerase subunit sigma-24 [Gammaproteobacteria bacterium HGW-Gammaproteobacteria-12]
MSISPSVTELIERLYRAESRRVLATLIRLLGDFDLAEEALHEAFRSAVEQWPQSGVPDNPRAWLVSAGRFKAIDNLRRQRRFQPLDDQVELPEENGAEQDELLEDDRLRLIFTCCHPALVREVCDLTTEEIARAFLSSPSTLAQRIVRAKAKIRDARIPYEVPGRSELPERLDAVLRVIYLVFNEGYFASSGDSLTRSQLSDEAIRLGRLLLELLPEPEVQGLLALMLLHESRRAARSGGDGEVILLDAQDRSLWNRELIAEGEALVLQALHSRRVIELNRAVALAMHDGEQAGLVEIDRLLATGELDGYHLAHAARADLLRRLGRREQAVAAYRQALALAQQGPDRQFLQKRLEELGA